MAPDPSVYRRGGQLMRRERSNLTLENAIAAWQDWDALATDQAARLGEKGQREPQDLGYYLCLGGLWSAYERQILCGRDPYQGPAALEGGGVRVCGVLPRGGGLSVGGPITRRERRQLTRREWQQITSSRPVVRRCPKPPLFCPANQTSVRPRAKEASHRAINAKRRGGRDAAGALRQSTPREACRE